MGVDSRLWEGVDKSRQWLLRDEMREGRLASRDEELDLSLS